MPLLLLEHYNVKEPPRTTYAEVFIAVMSFPASMILRNLLVLPFPALEKNDRVRLIVEHFLYLLPFACICFENLFSDQAYPFFCIGYVLCVILTCLIILLVVPRRGNSNGQPFGDLHDTAAESASRSAEIRQFRAIVYLATIVCIFARDLKGFRLRFAKTLAFGTALMDVGIGSFVFSMGMTGITARKPAKEWSDINIKKEICGALRVSLLLLAIGLVKLTYNLIFGIKEPEFEYGTHWNVFFTLAFVKIAGTVLELLSAFYLPPALIGLLISVAFELVQEQQLKKYLLMNSARTNFFNANREGIIQLPGLVALYLIALEIGRPLLRWRSHPLGRVKSMILLFSVFAVTCIGGNVGKSYRLIEIECRMSTNFAYVLFMVAFPTFFLGLLFLIAIISDFILKEKGSAFYAQKSLLYRIDRVGFVYFLLGNLLTKLNHALPNTSPLVCLVIYVSLTTFLALHTFSRFQQVLVAVFRGDFTIFARNSSQDDEKASELNDIVLRS